MGCRDGRTVGKAMPHKPNYAGRVPFSPDVELLTTIEGRNLRNWDSTTGKSFGKRLRLPAGVRRSPSVRITSSL